MLSDWEKSSVIDKRRLPILKEAIVIFNVELYYGCVSALSCQLNGIITDTYEMHKQYGRKFDKEGVEEAYKNFNPKIQKPYIKTDSEKTQLLWFITDAEDGILYWIKAIEYIYNTILTSKESMNESSHSCRNKVCHGIQMNFGRKEHALKSILTIDMMIRLAENLKQANEERED